MSWFRRKKRSVVIGSISNVTGGTVNVCPGNITITTVINSSKKKKKSIRRQR